MQMRTPSRLVALLAVVLALGWSGTTSAELQHDQTSPESELCSAFNEGYTFNRTGYADTLASAKSNLKLEMCLWTRRQPAFQATLYTHTTLDRLGSLKAQCMSWRGPFSAALYLPIVQREDVHGLTGASRAQVQEAVTLVRSFFTKMDALPDSCQLQLLLFYEVFEDDKARILYPVNMLRNYARLQVRTQLLAMVDVDLVVSASLPRELSDPRRVAHYERMCAGGKVFVLPAFDPNSRRTPALRYAEMAKPQLNRAWQLHEVAQFKVKTFPSGHRPTDYRRWFDTQIPYEAKYKSGYEPWFLAHWDVMPWYDVRYRGYGFNKIVAVASLQYSNRVFAVHPNAWLLHLPHEQTEARLAMKDEARQIRIQSDKQLTKVAMYSVTKGLFEEAKQAMANGTYRPAIDARLWRVVTGGGSTRGGIIGGAAPRTAALAGAGAAAADRGQRSGSADAAAVVPVAGSGSDSVALGGGRALAWLLGKAMPLAKVMD